MTKNWWWMTNDGQQYIAMECQDTEVDTSCDVWSWCKLYRRVPGRTMWICTPGRKTDKVNTLQVPSKRMWTIKLPRFVNKIAGCDIWKQNQAWYEILRNKHMINWRWVEVGVQTNTYAPRRKTSSWQNDALRSHRSSGNLMIRPLSIFACYSIIDIHMFFVMLSSYMHFCKKKQLQNVNWYAIIQQWDSKEHGVTGELYANPAVFLNDIFLLWIVLLYGK